MPLEQPAMTLVLEDRPYRSDASDAECAAILSRISVIEEGIIRYVEVPRPTPFTFDLMFGRVEELAVGLDRYTMLVDLNHTQRPTPEHRAYLGRRLGQLMPRLCMVSVYADVNIVFRTVAKFVLARLKLPVTVYSTEEEAVDAARQELAQSENINPVGEGTRLPRRSWDG